MGAMKLSLFILLISSCFMNSSEVLTVNKQDCPAEAQKPWSYDNNLPNGVQRWGQFYPQCRGLNQSPINILTSKVRRDLYLPKLQLYNYDRPVTQSTIKNYGFTVTILPTDGVQRAIRIGGDIYTLNDIHFHWGDRKTRGSEHRVDYKQYSMEVHFVHTNSRGRTAVVGAFYQEAHVDNLGLTPVTNVLAQVPYMDDAVDIKDEIYLDDIIDNMCSFFRYNGSLTTPGCTENVIWTICRDVHNIGHNQINEFRKLYSVSYGGGDIRNCKISNNYRPAQPLNGRTVVSSAYFGSF